MKYDCVAAASFKRGRSIAADRQFTCRLKTRVVIGVLGSLWRHLAARSLSATAAAKSSNGK